MRLCLASGAGPDYEAVAESLPEHVFQNWRAFDAYVEPFEDRRMDSRIALLAMALEHVLGSHEAGLKQEMFSLSGILSENTEESQNSGEDWRLMKAKIEQIIYLNEENE